MVYGKVQSCVVGGKDGRVSDWGIDSVSFKIKTLSKTVNGPLSQSESRTESYNHRNRPNNGKFETRKRKQLKYLAR